MRHFIWKGLYVFPLKSYKLRISQI